MANNGILKMKMLALWEILRQESDLEHPLSTNDICEKLNARGIHCERKSVATDIALLRQNGFDIEDKKIGKDRVYFIEDRAFDVPELKIIIDAVQAANFITEKRPPSWSRKSPRWAASIRALSSTFRSCWASWRSCACPRSSKASCIVGRAFCFCASTRPLPYINLFLNHTSR